MNTSGQQDTSSPTRPRLLNEKRHEEQLILKDRALASSAEGITISDPGQPDNPLIYANAGFERLTGYSVTEVLGKNCRFLQGSETDQKTVDDIRAAIKEEQPITVELLNYRKDGTSFWNRLSITPVRDARGQTTHYIGVQSDVSARRNAEDGLRKANLQLKAASQRMKNDLEAAARIQQALLPTETPRIKGVNFAWTFKPCDELAGDIFNIFELDDQRTGIYILDVCGHGVPAALHSVTLSRWLAPVPGQSCLFTPLADHPGEYRITAPSEVARQLNQRFQLSEETPQFFTFLYGILDTARSSFCFTCAGHPAPILCPVQGQHTDLELRQAPIGVLPDAQFPERVVHLHPGDRLFFYTDGIIEAFDEEMEQFGYQQLIQVLEQNRAATIEQSLSRVVSRVEKWCGKPALEDDATMIALEIERPEELGRHTPTMG